MAAGRRVPADTPQCGVLMARLYEETGDDRFLRIAEEGARHIRALAAMREDAALLHLQEPDATDLFYLGYCGGTVGTARLFHQLAQMTSDQTYMDWTARFARGISARGSLRGRPRDCRT